MRCFADRDYPSTGKDQIFVDFGSNIGVSAAYFLTRSHIGFAYLYEPVPLNVVRLRENLAFLEGRFAINEVAVGTEPGMVRFGVEETGRYGGIGVWRERQIEVQCVDSNEVLQAIIAKHGRIDIVKVDIEGLESEVVTRTHTVVISLDEKSQIQALDRTQPGLPMKKGRCATMTRYPLADGRA